MKATFTSCTTGLSGCLTCIGFQGCTLAATYGWFGVSTCSLFASFAFGIYTFSFVSLDNSSSRTCRRTTLKEKDVLLITFWCCKELKQMYLRTETTIETHPTIRAPSVWLFTCKFTYFLCPTWFRVNAVWCNSWACCLCITFAYSSASIAGISIGASAWLRLTLKM